MGAMENWGLVTFRETAVLVDPKNTSAKTKQWVSKSVLMNKYCFLIACISAFKYYG
jgi:aminopeptidase N